MVLNTCSKCFCTCGLPGNLNVSVTYVLNVKNELLIHYSATTDKATPINLTNHSYFNLSGFRNSIKNHFLQINANEYTEKNTKNQVTGRLLHVTDTIFDFRSLKKIGTYLNADELKNDEGYDLNFVLKQNNSDKIMHAAQLSDEETGRMLNIFTNAPGIQMYTANLWDGSIIGSQNKIYNQHSAVALETQSFPDSPNRSNFPGTILLPGKEYHSTTLYTFSLLKQ